MFTVFFPNTQCHPIASLGIIRILYVCRVEIEVSNPRNDVADRNRGSAEVPISNVIPRVGNFYLDSTHI